MPEKKFRAARFANGVNRQPKLHAHNKQMIDGANLCTSIMLAGQMLREMADFATPGASRSLRDRLSGFFGGQGKR